MAVGDTVGNFFGASEDFQPSSGVEDIITWIHGTNSNLAVNKDGSATSDIETWDPAVGLAESRLLLPISNTNFIGTPASSAGFISGVQTNA